MCINGYSVLILDYPVLTSYSTIRIFKENPVFRLRSEDEETFFHIVFECQVLARLQFNLLGLTNPGEEIPMKNLMNRLLDLIKGTNLFAQK
jgi:hypothetical protein